MYYKKIYVFQDGCRYKIGITQNIPTRISSLACGCPNIKKIYESEYLTNPFDIEKKLHNEFEKNNIDGEWFSEVDISRIIEIIEEHGKSISYKEAVRNSNKRNKAIAKRLWDEFKRMRVHKEHDIDTEQTEKMRFENEQIEKFIQAINGIDCPNNYSDLIYEAVIGKNTEELVSLYNPCRFESFRAKLPKEINGKIDNLTMLIGSLIDLGWGYAEIKAFVIDNCKKQIEGE